MGSGPHERIGQIRNSIADIKAEDWDKCANPESEIYNPFIDHRFLKALEDSGCVKAENRLATVSHRAV